MSEPLLRLDDVQTHYPVVSGFLFPRQTGVVRAVNGVSLSVARGEVLGLVGESGCGKSTLARTIMQLAPATSGTVWLGGRNLTAATPAELKTARRQLQMVFQDPFASLNPRFNVYATLAEPLVVHGIVPRDRVRARVAELMQLVGLDPRQVRKYPHEFSGGQRQRIADEPVSALDVSIQAQILNLLAELVRRMHLTMVFIAHDLSVVKHISDRVAVMYLGKIVELGRAEDVIERPRHPYTQALVSAIPTHVPGTGRERIILAGDPPSPLNPPSGCAFHPRCQYATDKCRGAVPPLTAVNSTHEAACVRLGEF